MAEIAKAYVQIIPSARGMTDGVERELGGAGASGGASAASKFASFFKKLLPIAAIGKLVKDTLNIGGAYEQSAGGIERIYGAVSNEVMANARNAWKVAGMSAGEYAERVTGISAALKRSTGDMNVASKMADIAMRSMADNVATFNVPMETVSRAYQNFARNQYMMLDSLNLGYSGTREGMQQLLDEAKRISGVEYEIDNLADMIQAIEVIQKDIGFAGVAAHEAETTFTGSFTAMKATLKDFMTALFMGERLPESLQNLLEATTMFGSVLWNRLLTIFNGLSEAIPSLIPNLIGKVCSFLVKGIPDVAKAAGNLIKGIAKGFAPALVEISKNLPDMIEGLIDGLGSFTKDIAEAGVNLLSSLLDNLPAIISNIARGLPKIVSSLVSNLVQNSGQIAIAGVQLFSALVRNIPQIIVALVGAIPDIIMALVEGILSFIDAMLDVGIELINALINGITGKKDDAEGAGQGLLVAILKAFWDGILRMEEQGRELINGLVKGIKQKYEEIKESGRELIAQFILGIVERAVSMVNVGKGLIDALKQGVTTGDWSGILSWYNSLLAKMDGKTVTFGVQGKFLGVSGLADSAGGKSLKGVMLTPAKTGLSWVPYDDYPALLHRGERVLTAQENAEYNRGGMNNAAVVELLEGILTAVSNRGENTITINLDRRELGRARLAVV